MHKQCQSKYSPYLPSIAVGINNEQSGLRRDSAQYESRYSTGSTQDQEEVEDIQIYLGYLGSIVVPHHSESKGKHSTALPYYVVPIFVSNFCMLV